MEFSSFEEAQEFLKDRGIRADITPTAYGYWVDVDRKRIFATDDDERQAEAFFAKQGKKPRITIDSKEAFKFEELQSGEITGTFYVYCFPNELLSKKERHLYFKAKKYAERYLKAKTYGTKQIYRVKVDRQYLK